MRAIAEFGIETDRSAGYTGVWTRDRARKIASIGVHARDWVTWHGFALNVTTDLSYFDLMVPCGIAEVEMTSVSRELNGVYEGDLASAVRAAVVGGFASVFGLEPAILDPGELERVAATTASA